MSSLPRLLLAAACAAGAFASACSSSNSSGPGSAQTPPTNGADVETWLKTGQYKSWTCEGAPHAPRGPSIHGPNRICSNSAISSNASGTGNWPSGAAAVKELYTNVTDTTPSGYAVYLKTAADSAGGNNWYYYERAGTKVYSDGMGTMLCVSCHTLAGSDAAHTTSPNGRDFVYTP